MTTVISVEHLSKAYRLGQIGTGTFTNDLKLWWARMRGKPNPLARIGDADHGNRDGEEVWALKDVSFQVEQGEVLGIIGRNGAGKSTLLKILSRVTAPTSGSIKIKGRVASLLEVGTGFHPELTGRENIYLNGSILGMTKAEVTRKFDEIVDFAEVEKFIDTPVKRYSSGMYVRLAFAVAAHLDPEILVVDEVLAVGDVGFQTKCLDKMGNVASAGRTVVFVSHNMAAVSNLCNRVALVNNGHLSQMGMAGTVIPLYISEMTYRENMQNSVEDDAIDIHEFMVRSPLQNENNFLTTNPTYVEINYTVKKKVPGLRIGFDLKTPDRTVIWRAFDDDVINVTTTRELGNYVSVCKIPPNLLLDREYIFTLLVGIHRVRWITVNEINFSVLLHNISGLNLAYADQNRPGLLMPLLEWEIKTV